MNLPNKNIYIDGTRLGLNAPTYFIAEIGSNFDGSLTRAKELIHLAKQSGAQAAKFQNFTSDSLISDVGFKSLGVSVSHQKTWKRSVYETYKEAELPLPWLPELHEECKKVGITFMTSPYAPELVEAANKYSSAFKIGSGEITWLKELKYIASFGKPIILATGASSIKEVENSVTSILSSNADLVLLQCNTNYTNRKDNARHLNLNVLQSFQMKFNGIIVGLSDHMIGHNAVLAAVALGARVIEKHFTDDRSRTGPDHSFSTTPEEWRIMVDATRELEMSLGDGIKKIEANELETAVVQRRGVYAARDLESGEIIKNEDVRFLRPQLPHGISIAELEKNLGRKVNRRIKRDSEILPSDFDYE